MLLKTNIFWPRMRLGFRQCALGTALLVPTFAILAAPAIKMPEQSLQSSQEVTVKPMCANSTGAPQELTLSLDKTQFVSLSAPVSDVTIGNGKFVHARLISPKELSLLGSSVGATNMILRGRSGTCTVFDIKVKILREDLRERISSLFSKDQLTDFDAEQVGDSWVLRGTASDAVIANQVEELATSFVIRAARNLDAISGTNGTQGGTAISIGAKGGDTDPKKLVINMMSVEAPQQVMLEVKVAEVSKTLLDQLGASFSASTSGSRGTAAIASDFLSGTAGGLLGILKSKSYQIILEAEKKDGLVRILAEPNVMAVSGQEGSFLAGGKILIPVAQNNDSRGTTITLEEKAFGVGLKFTPTVLAGGRINLKVAPEVSELSRDGIGITATGALDVASVLPLITTRSASTTVQLFDGQSFAIGGLIKNSATANVNAFPFLGEIPVLGALFRSTDFQSEKSELVFVVTPRLVKPLPPDYQLPTDRVGEPDRNRVMLEGRVDTDPPARPTVAPAAPSAGGMELR